MPFANKSELETAVATWLARPDIAAHVPDFIRLAESDLQREVECVFEDATATGTLTGSGVLALPAACLYVRRIWGTGTPSQTWYLISPEEAANLDLAFRGLEARYAYRRGNSLLYTPGGSTDGYSMEYRAVQAALGDVGAMDTTPYLTNLYDALLYGALCHASPFLKADSRIAVWTSYYERILAGIRRLEWKKRTGGPVLQARPATWA